MRFGIEWEGLLFKRDPLTGGLIRESKSKLLDLDFVCELNSKFKLDFEPEWYFNEFELLSASPKKLTYPNFVRERNKILNALQEISKVFDVIIPCASICWWSHESIVSTGIHVHVSLQGLTHFCREHGEDNILWVNIDGNYYDMNLRDILSVVATYYKLKLNPSFRFLFSHHIWGKYRNYNYSYKKKRKFCPVNISPSRRGSKPWTIEVRVFDIEDLIFMPKKSYKLLMGVVEWAKKVIKNKLTESDILELTEMFTSFLRIYNSLNLEPFVLLDECFDCENFDGCENTECDNYDNYACYFSYVKRAQEILNEIKPTIPKRVFCFERGVVTTENVDKIINIIDSFKGLFSFREVDYIEEVF